MVEQKYQRDDFNLLYDYLWRNKLMAECEIREGKNKTLRNEASGEYKAYKFVIELMEHIEKQELTFSNGEIYKKDEKLR